LHDIHIVFSPFSPGKYFSETLINDGLFLPILSKSETIPYLQQVSIDPYLWRQLTILYHQIDIKSKERERDEVKSPAFSQNQIRSPTFPAKLTIHQSIPDREVGIWVRENGIKAWQNER